MKEMLNSVSLRTKCIIVLLVALFFIFNIIYVSFMYTNPVFDSDKLLMLLALSEILLILFISAGLQQLIENDLIHKSICGVVKDEADEDYMVLNAITDGILVVDRKGRIKTVNQGLCNILELEEKDIINRSIYNVTNEWNNSHENKIYPWTVIETLESRKEFKHIEKIISRDSEIRYVSVSTYILKNRYKSMIGVMAIVHDITQEKMLEEQLMHVEKLAIAGQMAAELAHEIKNPICSIKGLMQIIGKKYNLEDSKYYEVITNELNRINSLLQRFLTLTQNKPKLEKTNIKSLVEDMVPLIESYAGSKNININIDMQKEIPSINADRENIRQVIVNIVQNGIDALPENGRMHVSIWYDQINELVKLEFKDNGSGIKPEYLDKIFEPFFTTKKNGSGLGLAISRKIIENHCGKLFAFNNQDGGATFAIELPVLKFNEIKEDKVC